MKAPIASTNMNTPTAPKRLPDAEGDDDAGLRVLEAVEAVDRGEEEVADALAEVLRRVDLRYEPGAGTPFSSRS